MLTSKARLVLVWAALAAGTAAIALPFAFSTSPWRATDSELWPLAMPFYLAVPVGLAPLLSNRIGRAASVIRVAGWIAAAACAAMICSFLVLSLVEDTPSRPVEWAGIAAAFLVLAAGAVLVSRRPAAIRWDGTGAVIAIQIAYLANALLCLLLFAGDWQSGAWCAAAVSFVYAVLLTDAAGPWNPKTGEPEHPRT